MASKRSLWLGHYLEQGTKTFLNATESAKAAGYKCKDDNFKKQGYQNKALYKDKILEWMDEVGLSECRLKEKLAELLDAKEVKIFQHNGKIVKSEEFNSLGTQVKVLDMALKMKGLYAPELRKDVTNDLTEVPDEQLDKELNEMNEWFSDEGK